MNDSRFELMDIAKGLAILLVILGHIDVGVCRYLIYIFHVPFFFIISGYFFKKYDFIIFLKKKIKSILIPFISFGILLSAYIWGINCIKQRTLNISFFIHTFIDIVVIQKRCTTLWFLTALFLGSLIFYLLVKISPNDFVLFMVALIVGIIFIVCDNKIPSPLPWNIDLAFVVQIYFVTGYLLKKYSLLEKLINYKLNNIVFWVLIILALVISGLNSFLGYDSLDMFYSSFGLFPLTLIASILMSIAVFILCSHIHSNWLKSLGQKTITYFAIHQELLLNMEDLLDTHITRETNAGKFMYELVLLLIILFICFIIDRFIRNSKLKFMVGL